MVDEQPETRRSALDSSYFDRWYADMEASPTKDAILVRHLGIPSWLGSAGVLHWDAMTEIADGLALPEGGVLVDVACGRGGYGIEVARRCGAALVGVDFSAVALAQARTIAARLLPAGRADFRVGTLTTTCSKRRSQVPSAVHFLSRSWAVFHGPYRSGVSRQGAPVRTCHRIALITWR